MTNKTTKAESPQALTLTCFDGQLEINREDSSKAILEASQLMFGVESEDVFSVLLKQMIDTLPNTIDKDLSVNAVMAMLLDIKPQDAMEAMLVTQMMATHAHAMEWSRRAMIPEQTDTGIEMNVSRSTRLMRTFTSQVEALQRYRNKGKQTIQVQHVNVQSGGQAIVGDVKGGGG